MPKASRSTFDYIEPLNMNGLQGRMLRLPASRNKRREFLLVYGYHGSLERCFGLADALNDFGAVTVPDLPGFGGMKSFYKLGAKPDLDTLADYLAAFVKLRFRHKRLTICGLSFGFVVATRMLQKHPDIAAHVDVLISFTGFTRHDEFVFSRLRKKVYITGAQFFRLRLPAVFFRNVFLHPSVITLYYRRTVSSRTNSTNALSELSPDILKAEIRSWRQGDVRTYMSTVICMLTVDNCQQRVNVPVWHVATSTDNYFNSQIVEQHMQVIFSEYKKFSATINQHSVGYITNKQVASPLLPPALRVLLRAN